MNTQLLRRIADHIERYPESYDQETWFFVPDHGRGPVVSEELILRDDYINNCGTTACVAGWAVAFQPEHLRPVLLEYFGTIPSAASRLLDLPDDGELADWLFDSDRAAVAMPKILRAIADGEADLEVLGQIEYELCSE